MSNVVKFKSAMKIADAKCRELADLVERLEDIELTFMGADEGLDDPGMRRDAATIIATLKSGAPVVWDAVRKAGFKEIDLGE